MYKQVVILSIIIISLMAISGCATIRTTNLGVRWLDWTELSRLRFGQSLSEVTSICSDPLYSEHYGTEQMFSLYYAYRLRLYPVQINEYRNGFTTKQIIKAAGTSISYGETETTIRLNFIYDKSAQDYVLNDWIVVSPIEKAEYPKYKR